MECKLTEKTLVIDIFYFYIVMIPSHSSIALYLNSQNVFDVLIPFLYRKETFY